MSKPFFYIYKLNQNSNGVTSIPYLFFLRSFPFKGQLLILFCFFLSEIGFAQNLVPNSSFEDTVACPNNLDQINRSVGWSSYRQSPDYFNTCSSIASMVSVPNNFSGYHYPRTGNAYGGFIVGAGYREYLGIQLSQSLNIGDTYYASFYVCRAGSVNRNRAANKIGIRLSTVSYSYITPEPMDNISQVYTDSVVTDTISWFRIFGSFIADSAYNYIGLGVFFNDSLTTFISFDSIHVQAYYYVDDIILSIDSNCCTSEDVNLINHSEKVNIFPNPARDLLFIQGTNISQIIIYDVLGKVCLMNDYSSSSFHTVNVSRFRKGIYFVQLKSYNSIIKQKLIVE